MSSQAPIIKERLSIVDVISSYIKIEPSGKNYKAKCPFHNEKTPSFFISTERSSYYCFGCGAKGDIFSFVEHFEGTDFLGALKILALRAGVTLDTYSSELSKDEKERWYQIMEEATTYFEAELIKNLEACAYLTSRGLTNETISLFRVGYAPNSWRSVSDFLLKKGFSQNDLEKVGLIKKSDSGFYDRFRGRIMFPINDSSGRVIAFSGRIFGVEVSTQAGTSAEVGAKYLNSPDTPLFNKSNVLFGIDKAKSAIRTRGFSIIVEGQMDLIMSHQAGFTNTVAVSGTALADTTGTSESKINNLGLIRRLSPNVIFAFDGDSAGIRASGRGAMIAFALDMQVKVAPISAGKDPADIILENIDTWKNIIKNSVHIISFYTDRICNETNDLKLRGRKIREVIFPYLHMVKSAIEKSAYINEIHNKTGIREQAIIEDFERYDKSVIDNQVVSNIDLNKINNATRHEILLSKLFGIIFFIKNDINILKIIDPMIKEFAEEIGNEKFQTLKNEYLSKENTLSFEAEMWYGGKTDELIRDSTELILNIEQELLQEKRVLLHQSYPLSVDILKEIQNIDKKIEDIKNRRTK